MPDPTRKTVSASEMPALLRASKHMTPWMLYKKFTTDENFDTDESTRTDWGKRLQPLVCKYIEDTSTAKVYQNDQSNYVSSGLLGCTPDAQIWEDGRGMAPLEIKCVFDYASWMQNWDGGKNVPREYEIQLQMQMRVLGLRWGRIAAWVCSDVHYFDRDPNYELWMMMELAAKDFFKRISGELPPPQPDGEVVETPWLNKLFPIVKGSVLDLQNSPNGQDWARDVALYIDAYNEIKFTEKLLEQLRAKLLALAGENQRVELPYGINYEVQKWGKGKRINGFIPTPRPLGLIERMLQK